MFEMTANMTQKQLTKMLKKVEKESDIINKQNISNNHKDFLQLAWWGTRLRAKALLLNERLAQTECHPAPCTRAIGTHNEDNTFKAIVWLKGRRDENGKGHPALKDGVPDWSKRTKYALQWLYFADKYTNKLDECLNEKDEDGLANMLFQASMEVLEERRANSSVSAAVRAGSIIHAPRTAHLQ
jgi:hypothetical protein